MLLAVLSRSLAIATLTLPSTIRRIVLGGVLAMISSSVDISKSLGIAIMVAFVAFLAVTTVLFGIIAHNCSD